MTASALCLLNSAAPSAAKKPCACQPCASAVGASRPARTYYLQPRRSDQGHGARTATVSTIKVGARHDGTIRPSKRASSTMRCLSGVAGCAPYSPVFPTTARPIQDRCLRCGHHKPHVAAYRPRRHPTNFARNRSSTRSARLYTDPLAFRLQNVSRPGDPMPDASS